MSNFSNLQVLCGKFLYITGQFTRHILCVILNFLTYAKNYFILLTTKRLNVNCENNKTAIVVIKSLNMEPNRICFDCYSCAGLPLGFSKLFPGLLNFIKFFKSTYF